MNLADLTIERARRALDAGEFSAAELTEAYLERIAARNPELNAYLEVFPALAREQAAAADARIKRGESAPLTGIPLSIKDNILIKGQICSAASKMLADYRASYDATVIAKLKAQDAIFLGRTNLDEFAMGSSTENSAFGPTKNPRDLERVPGGSSGGSAAALAADLCLGALGSDTGGSIRQPAGFSGVVGFKPTYGAVSRSGLIAMASSLDQIGPLAKTVADAKIIFEAIRGRDPLDATSIDGGGDLISPRGKIGVPEHFLGEGIEPGVLSAFRAGLEKLRAAGWETQEISLPNLKYSLACYYIIMPAEASTNLARYDGLRYGLHRSGENLLDDYRQSRAAGFGPEVRRRIMLGTYVLSAGYYDAYYGQATRVRELIAADFRNAFREVDAVALPTTPDIAFRLGEKTADPLQMYLADIFTVSANLAGLPAISVPAPTAGLPVGLQLIGPTGHDLELCRIAQSI